MNVTGQLEPEGREDIDCSWDLQRCACHAAGVCMRLAGWLRCRCCGTAVVVSHHSSYPAAFAAAADDACRCRSCLQDNMARIILENGITHVIHLATLLSGRVCLGDSVEACCGCGVCWLKPATCAYCASGLPANPLVILVHQTCHEQGPAHSVAECPPIPEHPKYTIIEHVQVLSVLLKFSCCAALCCHTAVLQPLGSATLRWRSRWVVLTGSCRDPAAFPAKSCCVSPLQSLH